MGNEKNADTAVVCKLISEKLEKCGFRAFREFSAVDSLIYKNSSIGFYSLKSCSFAGLAINHSSLKRVVETDCVFEIRLMGRSCEFADYEELSAKCDALYRSLTKDTVFLIRSMEMGKAYQSMPLKRLTRDLRLNIRLCTEED